jgi:uncharacterized protein (TIGR03437 family)
VQVLFNGIAAPILYVQASQINLIVPFEIAGMNSVDIHVEYNSMSSNANTLPVTSIFPGIFDVLNQDEPPNQVEPAR